MASLYYTEVRPKDYIHVDKIEINGKVLTSVYNDNYYVNKRNKHDIILERYDGVDGFSYDRLNLSSMHFECIGLYFGVRGIFNDDLEVIELTNMDL